MGKGQVRAEDLHRALDAEISKVRTGSDWARLLDVATLFPTYGFGNVVLINLQMPDASWVARAETWEKLGRRVRTGQAIRILKPLRSRTAMADALKVAGRKYGDEGLVERQVIGFQVGSVYDVTATTGPPIYLPRTPSHSDAVTARALWAGLEKEAASEGFVVEVCATGDASEGYTDYRARRVVVADHLDEFRAVARLAHELGHVRMHSPQVGDGMCREVREVEAESVAYVVLAHHGLWIDAESFDYIRSWAREVDPVEPANVIKATGARVIKVARQLIDATDRHLKEHRAPLGQVPARPLDSAFLAPDLDGPAF
ncbi:ImmA/IrrE family metallo-endopeptidase [Kribbella sp. NPDC059898]|uniref:ImmA/IrrE family metallo-endopeptidase n=1 Tax=Kribbella sp. NPDC059898 TaxID=3346995 RepID=UPI0036512BC0